MSQPQTDFTPRRKIEERLREAREPGSKLFKHGVITIRFSRDYDTFVAQTAYALRHYMVYRTDGGNFARGLIRTSQHLAALHLQYLQSWKDGEPLKLYCIRVKRRSRNANQHGCWPSSSTTSVVTWSSKSSMWQWNRWPAVPRDTFDEAQVIAGKMPGLTGKRAGIRETR